VLYPDPGFPHRRMALKRRMVLERKMVCEMVGLMGLRRLPMIVDGGRELRGGSLGGPLFAVD
jgi:hypothetical protein